MKNLSGNGAREVTSKTSMSTRPFPDCKMGVNGSQADWGCRLIDISDHRKDGVDMASKIINEFKVFGGKVCFEEATFSDGAVAFNILIYSDANNDRITFYTPSKEIAEELFDLLKACS